MVEIYLKVTYSLHTIEGRVRKANDLPLHQRFPKLPTLSVNVETYGSVTHGNTPL